MRVFITLIAIIGLNGCINMDAITPVFQAETDTSYYLIDTKYRFFCEGDSKRCKDMTKVVSSRGELYPIENAYNQEVKGPNYPVSLMLMIMNPNDGSYKATPVGNEGRFFKVPKNDTTDLVWNTLSSILNDLFDSGS